LAPEKEEGAGIENLFAGKTIILFEQKEEAPMKAGFLPSESDH
jgi:hypothetical protein